MTSLFFTCPTTHQQAPTGIETDVQKSSSRLEGNVQRQMPALRRGARNLGARDGRAATTDFAGPSRFPVDCRI
jgi:hypothetical protein